ncbi:response regulator [Sulfurimonas sp.]
MINKSMIDIYKTLNILCVEDDENVLEIYKELFSVIFQKVYFAVDGIEGFESFQNNKIDIVLTDFQMPRCNGIQMMEKIRNIDSSIPIIMVTALESIEMLREAIELNITSFLKKPFTADSLHKTFDLAVRSVIAQRYLIREQTEKILYNHYQENLTFEKEKIITKNDLAQTKKLFGFTHDVYYKPKDILSGDSYIVKKIDTDNYFIFLVDGMGKGISASVTAMLCSAFVNYYINNIIKHNDTFSLKNLLKELLHFIGENLIEDEVISANFLHFNQPTSTITYATFSMPPILYQKDDLNAVHKLKSNNPPFASYTQNFNIDIFDISTLSKMLIYSDGLNENQLKNSQELYGSRLQDDFKTITNVEELQKVHNEHIDIQEDDITYVLINKT